MKKEEILERTDFRQFYSYYLPDAKGASGHYIKVNSPFRPDENASFGVWFDKGNWKDFATGETGTVIDFLMQKEGLDFKAALSRLADISGVRDNGKSYDKPAPVEKKTFIKNETQIKRYSKLLQEDKIPTAAKFLAERKISKEVCRKYSVGAYSYEGDDGAHFENIFFPVTFDDKGNAISFKLRITKNGLKEKEPKNYGTAGIFPAEVLRENKSIVLAEGEGDALSLISAGIPAVTNTSGAGTFREAWREYFLGKDVIVFYDNDEAGRNGARKAAAMLFGYAANVRVAEWGSEPDKYDIGDFMKDDRPITELEEMLRKAKPFKPLEIVTAKITKDNENRKAENDREALKETFYIIHEGQSPKLQQRAVAEYIQDNFKFCATDDKSRTLFFEYRDGCWEKVSTKIVHRVIMDLLYYDVTGYTLESISKLLANLIYVHPDKFNNRTDLINLNNCAYDLNNYCVLPHSPEFYFTFKTSYDFNAAADCPIFRDALAKYSLHDGEWQTAIWEIIGYCLTNEHEFHKMFWFTGSSGGNGKSSVTRVMQKLTGLFLTKPNFEADKLKGDFYKNDLIGKRLAITGDMPNYLSNIDIIKELTGGDWQSTAVKFSDSKNFKNTAKLVFAMNHLPNFSSHLSLSPILRRIYLLPFDYQIRDFNPDIEEQFEAELSGVFNFAISGLSRLRRNKHFTICKRGEEMLKFYSEVSQSLNAFLTNKLILGPRHSVWLWQIWEYYCKFMDEHSTRDWSNKKGNITSESSLRNKILQVYAKEITAKKEYCADKGGTYVRYYGIGIKRADEAKFDEPENTLETYLNPNSGEILQQAEEMKRQGLLYEILTDGENDIPF